MSPEPSSSTITMHDLLSSQVYDVDGRLVGPVRDVRLVQDGPVQANYEAALRVHGLIIGRRSASSRLGYDRARVNGPWIVNAIARALSRDTRYVPWETVVEQVSGRIELSVRCDTLEAPASLGTAKAGPS